MPIRNGGNAITIAPTPAAHRLNSNAQPTGTASTKRSECLRPKLAASAVDRVVLGPGVKVAAVANSIKAGNSTLVMGRAYRGVRVGVGFVGHEVPAAGHTLSPQRCSIVSGCICTAAHRPAVGRGHIMQACVFF